MVYFWNGVEILNKTGLCCTYHNKIYNKARPWDDASIVPDKFAFVERSSTMQTPVGCASDRTVLRQQDGGAAPRQVCVCASNKHPCGVFE